MLIHICVSVCVCVCVCVWVGVCVCMYVCVLECRMLPFAFWCVSVFTLCGMVFAEECILKLCHKEIRLFSYSS